MHLPLIKATFDAMHVDPMVVTAYHQLLRRMMDDLAGSMHRKGALGQHIAELMERHANGIARIVQNGYKPLERTKSAYTTANVPTNESSAVSVSHGLELIIAGTRNAHANIEKHDEMMRRRKWR
jgi:DNA-binding ferritin-like protein